MKVSHTQENINSDAAHNAVAHAIQHALKLKVNIAAAVVDRGGNLVSFLRTENGPFQSIRFAIDKAYTSASFSVATSKWDELLPKNTILRESIINRERFIAFGGGLPIIINEECIGAIGVSGASEEQDEACAQAGLEAII